MRRRWSLPILILLCLSVHDASAAGRRPGSAPPHRGTATVIQKAADALRQMLRWRLTGDGDFLLPPRPKESPTFVSPCGDGTPCPKTTL